MYLGRVETPPALPTPNPIPVLVVLCEDALFAIAGSARFEIDHLRALAQRRAGALRAAALGAPPEGLEAGERWLFSLCAAIAPISPPRWMPMADVIEAGLSLEHGARGMRSLFTNKPSEKEVNRVRSLGALAVRSLGAVLSATGTFHAEAHAIRATLIASLGLPIEDQRLLNTEPPVTAEAVEVPTGGVVDGKLARAIIRGGFYAAMGDGMDPREEQAVVTIARKLGLTTEDVNTCRGDARTVIDASKDFGDACVDAIRYLLEGDLAESERLAVAAARLTLPSIQRRDAITSINVGGPVTLGHKHTLDRKRREAVLGLSWVAAMRNNPTYARRAALAVRHNRVAADLGDEADAATIRAAIDRYMESELCAALEAATVT